MISLEMIRQDIIQDGEDFLSRCQKCQYGQVKNQDGLSLCAIPGQNNYAARLTQHRQGAVIRQSSSWWQTWLRLSEPCSMFRPFA